MLINLRSGNRRRLAVLGVPFALIVLASCGDDSSTGSDATPGVTAAPVATTATTQGDGYSRGGAATTVAPATTGAVGLALADNPLGTLLVDGTGRTLYLFTLDTPTKSACGSGCTETWAPLTSAGSPTLGTGLDAEDVGTLTREDGTTQVTFYGHPLYLFSGDAKSGDTNGQDSGGVWYVVDAEGNAVDE